MPRRLSAPSDQRGLLTSYGTTDAASAFGSVGLMQPVWLSFSGGCSRFAGGTQVCGGGVTLPPEPAMPPLPPVPPLVPAAPPPVPGLPCDGLLPQPIATVNEHAIASDRANLRGNCLVR